MLNAREDLTFAGAVIFRFVLFLIRFPTPLSAQASTTTLTSTTTAKSFLVNLFIWNKFYCYKYILNFRVLLHRPSIIFDFYLTSRFKESYKILTLSFYSRNLQ